jgi:maltodextrin utilization protein YvdJ
MTSNKNLNRGKEVNDEVEDYFKDKNGSFITQGKNMVYKSKNKLIILSIVSILFSYFLLKYFKPSNIIKINKYREKEIIYSKLLGYSLLYGLILAIIISVIVYNNKKYKSYLFEGCDTVCSV